MKLIDPCNERNAIKVAAFALEFKEEADEKLIQSLITLHQESEDLRSTLPRKQVHQAITFQLQEPQQTKSMNLGGVTFDRLTPDGTQEWSISLRSHILVVSCGSYTRWESVWTQAKRYFSEILPLFSEKTFSLVALEYIDEFKISDATENTWKKELFKTDSKYLPSNIHSLEGFWHSHHGFFIETNDGIERSTLNNVDIDYIVEPRELHKIMIRTQHKTVLQTSTLHLNNQLQSQY